MRIFAILAPLLAIPLVAADISGDWEFTAERFGEETYGHLALKINGDKITGKLNGMRLSGTLRGNTIQFTGRRDRGASFGTLEGTVAGELLAGKGTWFENEAIVWSARRPSTRPAAPAIRDFEPQQFYRNFSGEIPPVLHIFPGDTVRTWTVDAGGVDKQGKRRVLGGNPETGPFYVEGAFPGDTLIVELKRVQLNRDTAESGSEISYNGVTSDYVHDAKYDAKFASKWTLDRENGVATVAKPTARLKNYTVKLRPMLGCLAVAPPSRQSFRTGYLGSFGGNMDYSEIREGVTVYLPVYQPGALLFLGDGHAAQGDGELTGDALETSMDVEFTVDLVKNFSTDGPRAKNDDFLMSMGIGGSLGEAMREATAQLARWIEKDYKLNANESAVVLGTALRYDIAEVVDPRYHVVAKLPRKALATLQ